jgi:putative iron-regulated protein
MFNLLNINILFFVVFGFSFQSMAESSKDKFIQGYASKAYERYSQSTDEAKKLENLISDFLANPNKDSLALVKDQWIKARNIYSQTEVYRFFDSPIDDQDGPEGLINAWPMDEVYIDYVDVFPDAGVINDVTNYPVIDEDLLVSLNEKNGEKNISTGWHVIEFLLWGQDKSNVGPGDRSYTDYVVGMGLNADRRREYLKVVSALLVKDLHYVASKWDKNQPDNFSDKFILDPEAYLKVITAAKFLASEELAMERMYVAYELQDQEDEHSCFSDTTHNDIYFNFVGVKNILTDEYNGVSFVQMVELKDPSLSLKISDSLIELEKNFLKFPAPFDQAIFSNEGRLQIKKLVDDLKILGDLIEQGLVITK